MQTIKELSLSVSEQTGTKTIFAKQCDNNSRFLRVTIYNGATRVTVAQGTTVMINACRRDGKSDAFFGEICEDGTLLFPINGWMLELGGNVLCDVSLTTDEDTLSTERFVVRVEAASFAGGAPSGDYDGDSILSKAERHLTDQNNPHAVTAAQIGALEKDTSAGAGRVYGVKGDGSQIMRTITGKNISPGTLLYRENNGDCCMQDPVGEYSIANRRYVDAAKADVFVFTESNGYSVGYDVAGTCEIARVRGDQTYLIRLEGSKQSGDLLTYVLHNGQMVADTLPYDYWYQNCWAGVNNNSDGTVTVLASAAPCMYESIVCSILPARSYGSHTVTCFIEGTKVLLRNKDTGEVTEKNIEDVQAGDYLAFWSPAKGRLTQTRAVVPPVVGECDKYHRLSFSDGKTVDVFGNQFFWEIDRDQLINWTQLVPGESRVCTATGDIVTYTGSEEIVPAAPVRHYTLMTFKGRYLAGGIQVGDKVELFYPRLTAPEYAEYWNGLTEGDRNYFKRAWAQGMRRRNWRFSEEYEEATRELRAQYLAVKQEIAERQQYLDSTDYQTAKLAEGLLTEEEYAPVRAQRQTARDAINAARNTLNTLKEELAAAEQTVKTAIQSTLQKKYENAFVGKQRAERNDTV